MKFVQPIRDQEKIYEIKNKLLEKSKRNYMIFVLGVNTGLRVSDLVKLKVKDVRGHDHIIITEKKTGKDKRILITPSLKKELKSYIIDLHDDDYLIQAQGRKNHLSRFMVYKILKAAAKECGLREIGTHTLRKTFGYHFYYKYKNIAMLMDLFNHSSEKVTLRYIGINQDMLDKAMNNFKI